MAQTEETPEPLKYQTWVLRVSIHCEGCKKKVKKVLQGIDGVYKITTDSQQQKVMVTGNVEAETLIKKLGKTGKHAELWPEPKAANPDSVPNNNNNGGGGSGGKKKKNNNNNTSNKPNDPSEQPETKEPESDNGTASAAKTSDTEPTEDSPKPDKKDSEAAASATAEKPSGGGGGVGKKKGKKGNGGGGGGEAPAEESRKVEVAAAATAMSPVPCQDVYHYPMYQVPATYLVSYNTAQPLAVGSYYIPVAAAVSYDIFSEENANACTVM